MGQDRLFHHLPPPPIGVAHPVDQAVVMPQRQEIGHGPLNMPRRVAQHHQTQRPRGLDERGRADEIAKPHARKHRFRKRTDIDHPTFSIERLQGRRDGFEEGHLELVIILDNHKPLAPGGLQERQTAVQRHGGICRALVAGGGKDHIHPFGNGIGRQPIGVDVDRDRLGARSSQDAAQAGIAGVFNHPAPPLAQENLRCDPKPVLRAHGQKNLILARSNPSARQDGA